MSRSSTARGSGASSEPGSSFRSKLDDQRATRCRSPNVYELEAGRHRFEVAAIDRAGNRDRTAATFEFTVEPAQAMGPPVMTP